MSQLNNVCISGYVGKAGELRYTHNGKAVIDISIRVNTGQNKDDDKGFWLTATFWGGTAEKFVAPYIEKGDYVIVNGSLDLDEWENDGKKYYKVKIPFAQIVKPPQRERDNAASPAKKQSAPPPSDDEIDEADLPF